MRKTMVLLVLLTLGLDVMLAPQVMDKLLLPPGWWCGRGGGDGDGDGDNDNRPGSEYAAVQSITAGSRVLEAQ